MNQIKDDEYASQPKSVIMMGLDQNTKNVVGESRKIWKSQVLIIIT